MDRLAFQAATAVIKEILKGRQGRPIPKVIADKADLYYMKGSLLTDRNRNHHHILYANHSLSEYKAISIKLTPYVDLYIVDTPFNLCCDINIDHKNKIALISTDLFETIRGDHLASINAALIDLCFRIAFVYRYACLPNNAVNLYSEFCDNTIRNVGSAIEDFDGPALFIATAKDSDINGLAFDMLSELWRGAAFINTETGYPSLDMYFLTFVRKTTSVNSYFCDVSLYFDVLMDNDYKLFKTLYEN